MKKKFVLDKIIAERGIIITDISRMSGILCRSLDELIRRSIGNISILNKIAKCLGLAWDDLFEEQENEKLFSLCGQAMQNGLKTFFFAKLLREAIIMGIVQCRKTFTQQYRVNDESFSDVSFSIDEGVCNQMVAYGLNTNCCLNLLGGKRSYVTRLG